MSWQMMVALPAFAWVAHRALLGLGRMVEPRCPRCGERRWAQGPHGEMSCAACPEVKEQLEMELAA